MKKEINDSYGRKFYFILDKIKVWETFNPGFSADLLDENGKITIKNIFKKPINLWNESLSINKDKEIPFLPEDILILCIVYERDKIKRNELYNKLKGLLNSNN